MYMIKKLLVLLVSMFALSVLVFCIARLAPGDPLTAWYGTRTEKMSAGERAQAMERLGLDKPLSVQYVRWMGQALRGNFGISYKYKQDVTEVIGARIGNTLLLGGIGFVLIFVLSLLLGIFCAYYADSFVDRMCCALGTAVSCIPEFWLSLVLILIFSVNLHWLPGSGAYTLGGKGGLSDRLLHMVLPLTVVVSGHLWYYAYMIRNQLLEEMRADYVLLARVKGLSKRDILFRHCLKNIFPTYLGIMAISVPHVLGGTYIVETVFSYPGIGTLAYESARDRDYNLLMVLALLSGILVIFCNLLGQMIGERIDPRIRATQEQQTFRKGIKSWLRR